MEISLFRRVSFPYFSVPCPADYVIYTDPMLMTTACYFISTVTANFNDARAACMADGGDLAVPESDTENQFLYGIVLH